MPKRKKKAQTKKPKPVFEYRIVDHRDGNGVMGSIVSKMKWNPSTETWETVE
ncbi:MAG: hypothetical protein ACYS30_25320 [Planctomycetota bacterium]